MESGIQPPTQEQSAIVERVARIVSRVRGAKPDYARLAAELEPAIPFDVFGIALLRHDRQAVRVVVCTREAGGWMAHYHQHPLKDSMVEYILQHSNLQQQPEYIEKKGLETHLIAASLRTHDLAEIEISNYPGGLDGTPAQSGDALSGKPFLHSTLIAPLKVEDQVLGSLELGSTRIGAYAGEALQRLISAVAHVLAAAIESAQIGGSVEIQDRQRAELKNVSSALASEMDLTMILNRIVVGIAKALNISSAIITLDHRRNSLNLVVQHGLDASILTTIVEREVAFTDQAIIGYSLRSRKPHVSNDIGEDSRFPASQLFASHLGIRSILSYPLVTGSTVYGSLLLCSSEPGGFTPLKLDILSLFASQATIAIHNDMLLEATRERRRFQEAIEQLDRVRQLKGSASSNDLEELSLLKRVREESEQTFGVSFSSLLGFISDHLLTSSERDLQHMLHVIQDEQQVKHRDYINGTVSPLFQEQKVVSLIEKAEAAVTQTGLLGNASAALNPVLTQLYARIRSDMTTPWFVTDAQGKCIYVNPAAEIFCSIHLSLDDLGNLSSLQGQADGVGNNSFIIGTYEMPSSLESQMNLDTYLGFSQFSSFTLLDAFSGLLPRMRNADEVRTYLQETTYFELAPGDEGPVEDHQGAAQRGFPPTNSLRFVIAAEPVQRRPHGQIQIGTTTTRDKEPHSFNVHSAKEPRNRFSDSRTMLLNSAPSDRHYQFMRFALYDVQGQLLGNALRIQDVTEQVRDEKNKAVLLSTVSHDLRTPLTAIKAAVTGLLQPDITWDEQMFTEILEDIDAEADHLHSLINSFIEMSRIDMGALELEKEWCDLIEIVHSTFAVDTQLLAGHSVHTDFQPQLPMIYVDFVQIKRVLHCLLENAIHHSPQNAEIVIAIDTVARGKEDGISLKDSHDFLRVRVFDHGVGIPEGERERIFKTFYSLDTQGSGLGLAISRGIIEAHQGRIWVEPTHDGGSCFAFVLPIS